MLELEFIFTWTPFSVHFVNVEETLVGDHLLVRIESRMREQFSKRRTSLLSGNKCNDVMNVLGGSPGR